MNAPDHRKPRRLVESFFLWIIVFELLFLLALTPFVPVAILILGFIPFLGRLFVQSLAHPQPILLITFSLILTWTVFFSLIKFLPRSNASPQSSPLRLTNTLFLFALFLLIATLSVGGIVVQTIAVLNSPGFAREDHHSTARTLSRNNLHALGLALHNYHDSYNSFPPGVTFLPAGQPGHSWMTSLLPYCGLRPLYLSIHQDKPWYDPQNKTPLSAIVNGYHFQSRGLKVPDRDDRGYALARYAANSHLFAFDRGMGLHDITDGPSNTLAAGEVLHRLKPWGDPANLRDPILGINRSRDGFGAQWTGGGAQFLLMDGSARMITEKVDPKILRALALPNDAQPIGKY